MKIREIYMYVLGSLVILCTIIWFALIMFHEIPQANRDIINVAAGVFLGSGWTQILNYFFGSSKSSADKNETINNALNSNNHNEKINP